MFRLSAIAHRVLSCCVAFAASFAFITATNCDVLSSPLESQNVTTSYVSPGCSTSSHVSEVCTFAQAVNDTMNEDGKSLYFLVMAPYPDSSPLNPGWKGGPAVVPAALVARDLINAQPNILQNYTLEFLIADSGCNVTTKATNSLTSQLFYCGVNVVGIIGPGCSEATLSVAPLVTDERLSLIQIAPSATSPSLTNTTLYPNTFRPIASALGVIDTYIALIERMNYNHVGALYEVQRLFQTTVYDNFDEKVTRIGKRATAFGLLDTQIPVDEFRNVTRVIFVFASSGFARKILCLARHLDMLYPKFQFIFSNRRPKNFDKNVSFVLEREMYNCTSDEMLQSLYGMIFHDFRLTREDMDTPTEAAGVSYNNFTKLYEEARATHLKSQGLTEDDLVDTEHHSNYFDATWALALALNNSLPRLEERGLSLSQYRNGFGIPEITQIIREEILRIDFEGMRGKIKFSAQTHDGANVTLIDIFQVLEENSTNGTLIGYYDPLQDKPLELYNSAILINADLDAAEYASPHLAFGVVVSIIVAALFVTLFACQVASVVWGRYKSVKAVSPNLNHLIYSGCYLSLIGAMVYTNAFVFIDLSSLQRKDVIIPIHCSALQWSGTMTYSLVFGTLCVKRWRIYRIFNAFSSLPMRLLSDNILILVALLPLAVDIVTNIVWNLVDPWYFHGEQNSDSLIQATCRIDHGIVWTLCLAIPKGLLTFIVLYLAIATRNIPRKEFRQTKSINILIYALFSLTGILSPLFYILQLTVSPLTITISYLIFCLFEFAFVVLCIVLVLLPPLIPPITEKILRKVFKKLK